MPPIYERFERPLVARIAMGRHDPGTAGEHRRALAMLALSPGDRVLDLSFEVDGRRPKQRANRAQIGAVHVQPVNFLVLTTRGFMTKLQVGERQ